MNNNNISSSFWYQLDSFIDWKKDDADEHSIVFLQFFDHLSPHLRGGGGQSLKMHCHAIQ